MTNVEALKALYAALGGVAADVADATTITAVLNAIAAKYEGADDATTNAEAIANIADVAENIGGGGDNNVKIDYNYLAREFVLLGSSFESLEIPEGHSGIGTGATSGKINVSNMTKLKKILIPSTMQTIPETTFTNCTVLETITINKPEGSITGAPWGAPSTTQVVWTG